MKNEIFLFKHRNMKISRLPFTSRQRSWSSLYRPPDPSPGPAHALPLLDMATMGPHCTRTPGPTPASGIWWPKMGTCCNLFTVGKQVVCILLECPFLNHTFAAVDFPFFLGGDTKSQFCYNFLKTLRNRWNVGPWRILYKK